MNHNNLVSFANHLSVSFSALVELIHHAVQQHLFIVDFKQGSPFELIIFVIQRRLAGDLLKESYVEELFIEINDILKIEYHHICRILLRTRRFHSDADIKPKQFLIGKRVRLTTQAKLPALRTRDVLIQGFSWRISMLCIDISFWWEFYDLKGLSIIFIFSSGVDILGNSIFLIMT